jgi:Arc/MetJ-type ribon-helix-helix transcriptional regulator
MPKTPAPEPAVPEPAGPGTQRLSALEQALSDALGELPRDQVVRCVAALIPLEAVVEAAAPPHGGKVRKVSVSMPEELVSAVRARTGSGGFSRYVTDAVTEQVRLDLLDDLSAELQAEFGPFDEALVEEAMKLWHGSDE